MKLSGIHLFVILLFGLLIVCSISNACVEGMANHQSSTSMRGARHHHKKSHNHKAGNELLSSMEDSLKGNSRCMSELLDNSAQHERDHSHKFLPGVPTPKGKILPGVPTPKQHHRHRSPQGHNSYTPSNTANGIPGSQIPEGQEDLYILKSEIVPPVCPACPTNASCPREKPCPPCPPCARCPEPSFECKKVPNYQAGNTSTYLPKPVLTDFSQFGI